MSSQHKSILVVDDNEDLRAVMTAILVQLGYRVRNAADGFSALLQIRREAPDLILSDLNMPFMSGFELLSIVRRRFPSIRVIAMSGAFAGTELPHGVAADAFYGKGNNGIAALTRLIGDLLENERSLHPRPPAPLWIPANAFGSLSDTAILITCQECLRVFHQSPAKEVWVDEAHCPHCRSTVRFALVKPVCETDRTSFALAG
jgi:CheY-like chemotaxis protein